MTGMEIVPYIEQREEPQILKSDVLCGVSDTKVFGASGGLDPQRHRCVREANHPDPPHICQRWDNSELIEDADITNIWKEAGCETITQETTT